MADTENKPDFDLPALRVFVGGETPTERRDALTSLIAAKFLPKNADHEAVRAGRDRLLNDAVEAVDPAHRLLSIAEAIRLTQVVKRWLPDISNRLRPAFDRELPPLRLLPEADDRLNVARACGLMSNAWLVAYVAQSIAEEEQGEKTRAELMGVLLSRVGTLVEAVNTISMFIEKVRPQTDEPANSMAKRLTRVLYALRTALIETENETGAQLGKALQQLLVNAFIEVGRPQDEKAQAELAKELLLTVHDIVRTRLSVVTEASIYLPVAYSKQLCGGTWPQELARPLAKLASNVCEALVLLGRQGMRDQMLLGQLEVLTKYPERARAIARELAERHPELNEEVRDWLEFGRIRPERTGNAAQEAAASNADAAIGLALQAARQVLQSSEGLRERLLSSLEIFEPALLGVTKESLDKIKALAIQVEQAASLRALQLLGVPGEEIEASPKYFEVVGGEPRQRMVVRQPAVVKIKTDGQPGDAVLRGLVE
ncbi:hypothetical protein [Variovorax saccharolyticus]|uniref:hypothetical protein n=1 Tax=Variovorax saccharolyticus TaxID=3053516 RepID=UPI0025766639|nr:hypothetical protein [Variovorax sp. J22R187]MDM0018006.1 hypothetical protein [Variovorax sp. J22R187]